MQRFNVDAIEKTLTGFRSAFPGINKRLSIRRDKVDKKLIDNLLEAYTFLNHLLKLGIDLFSPAGQHSMLELNHLVLCGSDPSARSEYYRHILETRKKYSKTIIPVREWVSKHQKKLKPCQLAAGYYCRSLSQPQVFIEGNHRTGNIILNYLLLSRGVAPLIVSKDNAFEYFQLSGTIKFAATSGILSKMRLLVGYAGEFNSFLLSNTSAEYLR